MRQDFINEANIEAQLAVAGLFSLGPGLTCVADALECTDAIFDFEVPAVKEWLCFCGRLIYMGRGEKVWKIGERDLWKRIDEMSEERWEFWKKRLTELGDVQELGPETRKVAKTALTAMSTMENEL